MARSRLDCFYTNQALSNQQDKLCECLALDWIYGRSDHRPLHFARRLPRTNAKRRAIPAWTFDHPDFPKIVEQEFDLALDNDDISHPFKKLKVLKRVIQETAFGLECDRVNRHVLTI